MHQNKNKSLLPGMARILLKLPLAALLLWLLLPAAGADALVISLNPEPDPPQSGDLALRIQVQDDSGSPLPGVTVGVLFYMPAMGTMPYMEQIGAVTDEGGGAYVAKARLAMGGTWEITVTVQQAGTTETRRYSLTTGIPGITDKNSSRKTTAGMTAPAANLMDIGPDRLQRIGVKFARAENAPMQRLVRAVGIVEQDRAHREEVTLRYPGYVVKLFRGRTGESVAKGEPLFSIYSPELVTAQSEYLLAAGISHGSASLDQASAERLLNLGMSEADIKAVKASGKPRRDVIVRAPISGTVLEMTAREGAAVSAGQLLAVIGDLSKSFIVARVFQQDIHDMKTGQPVEIILPDRAGTAVAGNIDLIFPQIEPGAGTTNVRVATSGPAAELRPGEFVDLRIPIDLGTRLAIPAEAVLYSGLHNYVFVDRGEGLLEPRQVRTGATAGSLVEIRSGLQAGEQVVASGAFLLSSEAQLRSALPKWQPAPATAGQTVPAPAMDNNQQTPQDHSHQGHDQHGSGHGMQPPGDGGGEP